MAVQSGQLFGYGVEAEDIVVRRVSRRVSRYIESLNALGPALFAPTETPAAAPASPDDNRPQPPPSQVSPEFSDEVPTLVLRGRQDAGKVTEETPTAPVPSPVEPPAPPELPLKGDDIEEPTLRLPPLPKIEAESPVTPAEPVPPPTPQRPKAPPPQVAAAASTQEAPAKPVALREPAKKPTPAPQLRPKAKADVMPVSQALPPLTPMPSAAPAAKDSHDPAWKPLASPPVMLAAIVGLSVLLAALVYFLLTFNKFVY